MLNSSTSENLPCTDEVKVYEDEGEEEEQHMSSENLAEDKVRLVIETESQIPRIFDFFGKNGAQSLFKVPFPTDPRLASYFLPGYPAAIAAAMAAVNAAAATSSSSSPPEDCSQQSQSLLASPQTTTTAGSHYGRPPASSSQLSAAGGSLTASSYFWSAAGSSSTHSSSSSSGYASSECGSSLGCNNNNTNGACWLHTAVSPGAAAAAANLSHYYYYQQQQNSYLNQHHYQQQQQHHRQQQHHQQQHSESDAGHLQTPLDTGANSYHSRARSMTVKDSMELVSQLPAYMAAANNPFGMMPFYDPLTAAAAAAAAAAAYSAATAYSSPASVSADLMPGMATVTAGPSTTITSGSSARANEPPMLLPPQAPPKRQAVSTSSWSSPGLGSPPGGALLNSLSRHSTSPAPAGPPDTGGHEDRRPVLASESVSPGHLTKRFLANTPPVSCSAQLLAPATSSPAASSPSSSGKAGSGSLSLAAGATSQSNFYAACAAAVAAAAAAAVSWNGTSVASRSPAAGVAGSAHPAGNTNAITSTSPSSLSGSSPAPMAATVAYHHHHQQQQQQQQQQFRRDATGGGSSNSTSSFMMGSCGSRSSASNTNSAVASPYSPSMFAAAAAAAAHMQLLSAAAAAASSLTVAAAAAAAPSPSLSSGTTTTMTINTTTTTNSNSSSTSLTSGVVGGSNNSLGASFYCPPTCSMPDSVACHSPGASLRYPAGEQAHHHQHHHHQQQQHQIGSNEQQRQAVAAAAVASLAVSALMSGGSAPAALSSLVNLPKDLLSQRRRHDMSSVSPLHQSTRPTGTWHRRVGSGNAMLVGRPRGSRSALSSRFTSRHQFSRDPIDRSSISPPVFVGRGGRRGRGASLFSAGLGRCDERHGRQLGGAQSLASESASQVHIKKPLNAFMLFMKEMRSRVQEECTLKESAAINQVLGKKWHELSREEQTKYYDMARREKELHQQLYPNWSARDNYAYHARRRKRRRHLLHRHVIGQLGRGVNGPSSSASSNRGMKALSVVDTRVSASRGNSAKTEVADNFNGSSPVKRRLASPCDLTEETQKLQKHSMETINLPHSTPGPGQQQRLYLSKRSQLRESYAGSSKFLASSQSPSRSVDKSDDVHMTESGVSSAAVDTIKARGEDDDNSLSAGSETGSLSQLTPPRSSTIAPFNKISSSTSSRGHYQTSFWHKWSIPSASQELSTSAVVGGLFSAKSGKVQPVDVARGGSAVRTLDSSHDDDDGSGTCNLITGAGVRSLTPPGCGGIGDKLAAQRRRAFASPPTDKRPGYAAAAGVNPPGVETVGGGRMHSPHGVISLKLPPVPGQYSPPPSALRHCVDNEEARRVLNPVCHHFPPGYPPRQQSRQHQQPLHYPGHRYPSFDVGKLDLPAGLPPPAALFAGDSLVDPRQNLDYGRQSGHGLATAVPPPHHQPPGAGLLLSHDLPTQRRISPPLLPPSQPTSGGATTAAAVVAAAAMAASELTSGSLKKCRARFGLEHQNMWCKPCRRKKKCVRFISDVDSDDLSTSMTFQQSLSCLADSLPSVGGGSLPRIHHPGHTGVASPSSFPSHWSPRLPLPYDPRFLHRGFLNSPPTGHSGQPPLPLHLSKHRHQPLFYNQSIAGVDMIKSATERVSAAGDYPPLPLQCHRQLLGNPHYTHYQPHSATRETTSYYHYLPGHEDEFKRRIGGGGIGNSHSLGSAPQGYPPTLRPGAQSRLGANASALTDHYSNHSAYLAQFLSANKTGPTTTTSSCVSPASASNNVPLTSPPQAGSHDPNLHHKHPKQHEQEQRQPPSRNETMARGREAWDGPPVNDTEPTAMDTGGAEEEADSALARQWRRKKRQPMNWMHQQHQRISDEYHNGRGQGSPVTVTSGQQRLVEESRSSTASSSPVMENPRGGIAPVDDLSELQQQQHSPLDVSMSTGEGRMCETAPTLLFGVADVIGKQQQHQQHHHQRQQSQQQCETAPEATSTTAKQPMPVDQTA